MLSIEALKRVRAKRYLVEDQVADGVMDELKREGE